MNFKLKTIVIIFVVLTVLSGAVRFSIKSSRSAKNVSEIQVVSRYVSEDMNKISVNIDEEVTDISALSSKSDLIAKVTLEKQYCQLGSVLSEVKITDIIECDNDDAHVDDKITIFEAARYMSNDYSGTFNERISIDNCMLLKDGEEYIVFLKKIDAYNDNRYNYVNGSLSKYPLNRDIVFSNVRGAQNINSDENYDYLLYYDAEYEGEHPGELILNNYSINLKECLEKNQSYIQEHWKN